MNVWELTQTKRIDQMNLLEVKYLLDNHAEKLLLTYVSDLMKRLKELS